MMSVFPFFMVRSMPPRANSCSTDEGCLNASVFAFGGKITEGVVFLGATVLRRAIPLEEWSNEMPTMSHR